MTNEETLQENLLETCVNLEFHNLLEFAPIHVIHWYENEKLKGEQDFSPAEKMILSRAEAMRK